MQVSPCLSQHHHSGDMPCLSGRRLAYAVLLLGLLSLFGTRLTFVASGIWLFQHYDALLALSTVAVAALLPCVALQPWVGAAMDRGSPRRWWLVGQIIGLGCCALLWWWVRSNSLSYITLLVVAGVGSAASAVHPSFVMILVKRTLGTEDVARFTGWRTVGFALVELVVPVAATWLLTTYGLSQVVLVDTLSFCAITLGAVLLWRWLPNCPLIQCAEPTANALPLNAALRHWVLRLMVLQGLVGVVMITVMPLSLVSFSPLEYGWGMTSAGFGAVVGGAWAAQRAKALVSIGAVDGVLWALCVGLMAVPLWSTAVAFAMACGATGFVYAVGLSWIHAGALSAAPDEATGAAMGRVMALGGGACLIGVMVSSVLVDSVAYGLSVSTGVISGGVLVGMAMLSAVVLVIVRWR